MEMTGGKGSIHEYSCNIHDQALCLFFLYDVLYIMDHGDFVLGLVLRSVSGRVIVQLPSA